MEKKCSCGEKCDCVSREDYTQALRATAFLAEKVKTLDEKYKLALLGPDKRFMKSDIEEDFPSSEKTIIETEGMSLKVDKGSPLSNGKDQHININMVNPLPPGVSVGKNIVMKDKDIILDEEDDVCPSCGA
jgi:hypothetical protein